MRGTSLEDIFVDPSKATDCLANDCVHHSISFFSPCRSHRQKSRHDFWHWFSIMEHIRSKSYYTSVLGHDIITLVHSIYHSPLQGTFRSLKSRGVSRAPPKSLEPLVPALLFIRSFSFSVLPSSFLPSFFHVSSRVSSLDIFTFSDVLVWTWHFSHCHCHKLWRSGCILRKLYGVIPLL